MEWAREVRGNIREEEVRELGREKEYGKGEEMGKRKEGIAGTGRERKWEQEGRGTGGSAIREVKT